MVTRGAQAVSGPAFAIVIDTKAARPSTSGPTIAAATVRSTRRPTPVAVVDDDTDVVVAVVVLLGAVAVVLAVVAAVVLLAVVIVVAAGSADADVPIDDAPADEAAELTVGVVSSGETVGEVLPGTVLAVSGVVDAGSEVDAEMTAVRTMAASSTVGVKGGAALGPRRGPSAAMTARSDVRPARSDSANATMHRVTMATVPKPSSLTRLAPPFQRFTNANAIALLRYVGAGGTHGPSKHSRQCQHPAASGRHQTM